LAGERWKKDRSRLNPARELVTGVVCGLRVEEVEGPRMRVLRQVDKMVDGLGKGWGDGESFAQRVS
jgi:hypothetical protein